MKKILVATVISSALLLGMSTVNAKPYYHHQGPHMDYKQEQMKKGPEMKEEMARRKALMEKRLNITAEQKEQLKAIHESSKEKIAPKIKALTEAEFELSVLKKREFNKDKFGIATLEEVQLSGKTQEQLMTEIKTLKNEIKEIKKANFEESQKIFTSKQKKELEKMRKERKHKKFHSKKHKNYKKF